MTTFKTRIMLFAIAAAFCSAAISNPSVVSAAPQASCDCSTQTCTTCHQRGGCLHCPECSECVVPPPQEYCELAISEGKETRTCFEVDYKSICIPKIVPPWRNCEPLCAETRSVKVLTTKKYECPVCKYQWSVKKPEYQQLSTGNASQIEPMGVQSTPLIHGAAQAPGIGTMIRSIGPVNPPAGKGIPIIPAKTGSPQSSGAPETPIAPPAPPVSGSIGDYFGGR